MKSKHPLSTVKLWPVLAAISSMCLAAVTVRAGAAFNGVAAGDASSTNVVLWTRAVDTNAPAQIALTAQISPDASFGSGVITQGTATVATNDYTAKLSVSGLTPNTRYYYRFTDGVTYSIPGTFKTAPASANAAPVRFAFSGDYDGLMRPYVLGKNFDQQNLDFFVNLGDTIYETASTGSSAAASTGTLPGPSSTGATQSQLFADFSRKYREQFAPVNVGGQNALQTFYAAQGNYTLLDNHELGNKQYINGGAAPGGAVGDMTSGAGVDARVSANDVNATGTFMSRSTGFQILQQVFMNYQPIRERGLISSPTDPRTDGTRQLYFAQPWGRNAVFIGVDDRSYRDIRLKTAANADDTGARADNLNRTMLGATQLAWLEQTLLAAQSNSVPWKFVAISSPIDQIGPIGGALTGVTNGGNTGYVPVASDGGKSWIGGYRAERNALLKFIADNRIYNVVFLSTDDHQNRINELLYSTNGQTALQSSYARVPFCFEIVDGPFGATGPDGVTNHTFANNKVIADSIAAAQSAAGLDPIGLDPAYPGLHNVTRENDPDADASRQPVDFYSPDTFNFNTLKVSADGRTLTVKSLGVNSTAQNSFGEYDAVSNPMRELFSFQVDAATDFAGLNHLIVIYQENWSFDSLYGKFPGANGLTNVTVTSTNQIDRVTGGLISALGPNSYDPVSSTIPIQNPPVPLNGTQDKRFLSDTNNLNSPTVLNTLLPYDLAGYVDPSANTGDLVHRYWQEQFQINGGKMNQFVTWSDNPGLVMSYFDASSLPEGILAQQYTMCDNFFHSAFGGSFLNHQFLVAARPPVYPNGASLAPSKVTQLDGNGLLATNSSFRIIQDQWLTPIGGVIFANTNLTFDKNYAVNTAISSNLANGNNPTAATFLPSLNDSNPGDPVRPYTPTIGNRLDGAGISWKWYSGGWDRALAISSSNPTNNGVQKTDASISLFQWHHQPFAYYDSYAPWTNGSRNARSAAHLQDENNFFADITNNSLPAVSFVKPLGPDNEHPGYASLLQGQLHVSNIVAAVQGNPALWAHTAIIVTYDEHGGRWDHAAPPVRDIWGPGSRVPAIVISPLARKGFVDHSPYETLSILSTIEKRFGLAPLSSADAAAPTLAAAFDGSVSAGPQPGKPPLISTRASGPNVLLNWTPGSAYVLQMSTNLAAGSWVPVYNGTNNAVTVTPNQTNPAAFFRLVLP